MVLTRCIGFPHTGIDTGTGMGTCSGTFPHTGVDTVTGVETWCTASLHPGGPKHPHENRARPAGHALYTSFIIYSPHTDGSTRRVAISEKSEAGLTDSLAHAGAVGFVSGYTYLKLLLFNNINTMIITVSFI